MSDSEVICLAYNYSEERCVEAAHEIQRAMEQWHRGVMMLPQDDKLFGTKLSKADLAETWLVPEGTLVVGVGLGGLAAATIQETKRPDLDVVCVSSPTSYGAIKLERRMQRRVALYSSQDPAIASRVENWPDLAEAESGRIEYKEDLPQDLGDDIAALANGYGGLLFVGIKADKNQNNIPVQWDGAQLGSDYSARISNHILSTVRPRPQFNIGLVKASKDYIAIVRVSEGDYRPYEYEKGNTVRISLRVNDTKRQASVRDIEMLMGRRNVTTDTAQKITETLQPNSFYPFRIEALPGGATREVRDDRVHQLLLAPRQPVRWRLDSTFERYSSAGSWRHSVIRGRSPSIFAPGCFLRCVRFERD